VDVAVMNDFLDLILESASWELELYDGDPKTDGAELDATTAPGYAPVTVAPADWADAADGEKSLTVPAQYADATGAWTEPSHLLLRRVSDGAAGPSIEFQAGAEWPTAAGDGPAVQPTIHFDDAVEVGA
jgi:hypothetical protein